MAKALPPFRALIAFEASVRHASFKEAARELNITPGAVSQQVQKLEDWLGYPLFIRMVRQLKVNERGLKYYAAIAPALEQISQASGAFKEQSANAVHLSLTPTMAAKWLGPRLEDFIRQHPKIEVHIDATLYAVDFQTAATDIAIRHFDGRDPTLETHLMFQDEIRVYCSPAYRDKLQLKCSEQLGGDQIGPEQIKNATLLNTISRYSWKDWLPLLPNLTSEQIESIPQLFFDQALLAIDAARRSQGLILNNELLTQTEVRNGELIEPFKLRLPSPLGYYLIHPKNRPLSKAAKALKAWLLEQQVMG